MRNRPAAGERGSSFVHIGPLSLLPGVGSGPKCLAEMAPEVFVFVAPGFLVGQRGGTVCNLSNSGSVMWLIIYDYLSCYSLLGRQA